MSQTAHRGDENGNKGKKYVAMLSDSEGSSIGVPSDDDEVHSRVDCGGTLNSLESSLPTKKSLSLHYDGRSKSYSSFAEEQLVEATELAKQEHALNKINMSQKFSKYSKKSYPNHIVHQLSMLTTFCSNEDDDNAENGALEDAESKSKGSNLDSD